MTTTRRLAAILAADIAGYSRLMAANEVGTLTALKAVRREVVDPTIAEHKGRIVKTTGDGMLVEFASAVDAVTCAMAVQEKMAAHGGNIAFRIGINVGDIIIEDDDIFGDGVNVAARLENECKPGGVYLSDDAFRQVRSKTSFAFDDLGEKPLKNIDRPIRIYASRITTSPVILPGRGTPLPLPDKPSIAVLPFQNMSGDPEQEYFADGMVEDIITALSRFKSLFVIARNSSFTYKGKVVDIKQVGRELGVRYVLEGSVRKSGGRVRITGQLIDASTSQHLWADKFDGAIEDIFELQDSVTEQVVGHIAPHIEMAEVVLAKRKPVESLEAYDFYIKGRELEVDNGRERIEQALTFYRRAIELDPTMALAYACAAKCYSIRKTNGWVHNEVDEAREAKRLADIAVELGRDDAFCLTQCVLVYAFVLKQNQLADGLADRALSLNPNLADGWRYRAFVHLFLGRNEQAIEAADRAIRLSPRDSGANVPIGIKAWAFLHLHRYDECCAMALQVNQLRPAWAPMLAILAIAHAQAGRLDDAQAWVRKYCERQPTQRLSNIKGYLPIERSEDIELWLEGLRLAGMPE